MTTPEAQQGEWGPWEVAGHNGVVVDAEAGKFRVSRVLKQHMAVIARESETAYDEYVVGKRDASRLRDYANALESRLAQVTAERDELRGYSSRPTTDELRSGLKAAYDKLAAAEKEIDRQSGLLKDALRYLKWQRDEHENPGGMRMAPVECRCDWCKTVRDYFGFDNPEAALEGRS